MRRRSIVVVLSLGLVAGAVSAPAPAGAQEAHTAEDATIESVPDASGAVTIHFTVFKPAGASPANQVPVIFHSHGWGGSRSTTIGGEIQSYLDAGLGVVSIDQRGHGASGGQANVQDPDYEAQDIKKIIDYVGALDWVEHDVNASGNPIADDPVLGAVGGSYGGGYQWMTALTEVKESGRTRFNALAPEISWFDLPESLAPQGVARTGWVTLLYAAGAGMVPQYIHESYAYGAATGQWPDGTVPGVYNLDAEFTEHSPVSFVEQGYKLDIPTLVRQGSSDNLFNLNQGIHNFQQTLTDSARAESLFVAYNGGHALPNALPLGYATGADECSGDWTQTRIDFFKAAFEGGDTRAVLPNHYNLTTADGACLGTDLLGSVSTYEVDPAGLGAWGTPAGAGAPVHVELASGPLTVAGIPRLTGDLYNLAVDSRAFFALSVGSNAADAQVVQNNMMPLRSLTPHAPGVAEQAIDIELPAVVVDIPAGEKLFLTISPVSDMSFGHGSRAPGAIVIQDLEVHVPLL
ncbi:MAG: peptidase S15 [Actinobacteria bacterium]|nr:peptidase S15 [Actinomycetota bacterium]